MTHQHFLRLADNHIVPPLLFYTHVVILFEIGVIFNFNNFVTQLLNKTQLLMKIGHVLLLSIMHHVTKINNYLKVQVNI